MSVKKLGKAIVKSFKGKIVYILEGTNQEFLSSIYSLEIEKELKSMEHPSPPPIGFSLKFWDDSQREKEKREYEAEVSMYEKRREKLCDEQLSMIQKEISSRPVKIYLLKRSATNVAGFLIGFDIKDNGRDAYYLYKDFIYKFDKASYSDEEKLLLIADIEDKERRKFEHLKHKLDESTRDRRPIPEDVRNAVWRRDEGKCVKCGSRENIEYDHIIPVSKGGSNTARNIELLCEKCNRQKHDNIQ